MAEAKRWNVTYTKHVKQKRKVYQDGYLQLSNNKIFLYDDCDKDIDSRFLKKDETIKSGETLAFDSHLVDISSVAASCEPVVKIEPDCEVITERHGLPRAKKLASNLFGSDRKPGLKKFTVPNVSPSQKIIRDFKKNELLKYYAQKSPPSSKSTVTKEWTVLYTGQMTQKAKKYHDGFLKLVICGTQRRQVNLYDNTRTLIDSRFLKKEEVIKSGDSLKFDAHLVDIGESAQDLGKLQEVKVEGQSCVRSKKNMTFEAPHLQHVSTTGRQQGDYHLKEDMVPKPSKLVANQMPPHKGFFVDGKWPGDTHLLDNMVPMSSNLVANQMPPHKMVSAMAPLRDVKQPGDAHLLEDMVLKSYKVVSSQVLPHKEASTKTPLRDANSILSSLKKPAQVYSETMRKVPVKPYFSPSADLVQLDVEIQDDYDSDNQVCSSEPRSWGKNECQLKGVCD